MSPNNEQNTRKCKRKIFFFCISYIQVKHINKYHSEIKFKNVCAQTMESITRKVSVLKRKKTQRASSAEMCERNKKKPNRNVQINTQ